MYPIPVAYRFAATSLGHRDRPEVTLKQRTKEANPKNMVGEPAGGRNPSPGWSPVVPTNSTFFARGSEARFGGPKASEEAGLMLAF